mgnify:CR=1 FL=1
MTERAQQPGPTTAPEAHDGDAAAVAASSGSSTGAPLPTAGATGSAGGASDTGAGLSTPGGKVRERFDAFELAVVLSHYDLGIIESIQEFPRGSRKAPKLLLRADTGSYLLKRRARGKDDPYKVAFCHGLQLHLADRQFPLPHLVGTKRDNNSMLRHGGAIYECFEYIKGSGYDGSLEATTDAGKTLSLFHKLLADYRSEYEAARGSYHHSRSVHASLERIPTTLLHLADPMMREHSTPVRDTVAFLQGAYDRAAHRVDELGLGKWKPRIVHGDWHPGNMLFRGHHVAAVIDYDTARIQPRVLDVGNGALQFSILGGGDDPAHWPDYLDETRFKRFIRGYESVPDMVLAQAELRCIPWLMMEALIAEMTIPIANTGRFGRMDGVPMLFMVERKVRWLENKLDGLVEMIAS